MGDGSEIAGESVAVWCIVVQCEVWCVALVTEDEFVRCADKISCHRLQWPR
jgi:hypothetical protein